jgi:SAM-dependent methyltransferase
MTNEPLTSPTSDTFRDEYGPDLVGNWDTIADWATRQASEGTFFVTLLNQHGVDTVLDAATGTGYHAWSLSTYGFAVTASDGAPEMVRRCRENLAARSIDIPVTEADWRELSTQVPGTYDAVLCLGNSFCHLFAEQDRRRTLEQFAAVLNPGGVLVMDTRNYDGMLANGFTEQRQSYCCGGDNVVITAPTITEDLVQIHYTFPDRTVLSVQQAPTRHATLVHALENAGFDHLTSYGDLAEDYDPLEVEFVIHVARKR